MKSRLPFHLLGVVLLSVIVWALFLREPGLGDDFTYWSFAFDIHERGVKEAWSRYSFHDLRWPVWGVSWILQGIFGPGLFAYYGVPLIYLTAGALLAFTFGRLITGSLGVSWIASAGFLFHPLLDTVAYRPMPDLSEAVWGGLIILTWWKMVQARSKGTIIAWSALLGALVFLIQANRLTGVFIVAVLLVCTLLYARRAFGWLVLAGVFSLMFYAAEAAFYHHLFGDWLHSLNANMGGKGKKGTEAVAFWYLPFRFLDTLWKANSMAPFYCLLAAVGIWALWRPERRLGNLASEIGGSTAASSLTPSIPLGRVVVVWFVTLYLAYACAPQSIWPWRPIVRDADRFLSSLTIPFSVLTAVGLFWLLRQPWLRQHRWSRAVAQRPALACAAVFLLLVLGSGRDLYSMGSVPEMRRYMQSLPDGTKVFTHDMMRAYAFLVDGASAGRFQWLYSRKSILNYEPKLEALAAQADEFWYLRKLVWLNTRKALEDGDIEEQAKLASYFAEPTREWTMAQVLAKGDASDLIFHRRRTADTPPPVILQETAPEFGGLIPTLPIDWKSGRDDSKYGKTWEIPEKFRGMLCRVELEASSNKVQAFNVYLYFKRNGKEIVEYLLKPYTHPQTAKEFFEFKIPADADQCLVEVKLLKGTKSVRISDFEAVFEPPK